VARVLTELTFSVVDIDTKVSKLLLRVGPGISFHGFGNLFNFTELFTVPCFDVQCRIGYKADDKTEASQCIS
jgi:hypothetical protein